MRQFYMILLFGLSIIPSYSQESDGDNVECEDGRMNAVIDFNNGTYFYENYIGLTSQEKDFDFEKYYQLYLEKEFNIKTKTTGCTVFVEEWCYLRAMDSLLGNKYGFGESFFKVNKKQQEERFKGLTNREKATVLNDDKFYEQRFLDSFPEFKGDKQKLRNYFERYFAMENRSGSFGVEFIINKNGEVVDLDVFWPEILKNRNMADKENVIRALNSLGPWKSGRIYNKDVNSISIIRI